MSSEPAPAPGDLIATAPLRGRAVQTLRDEVLERLITAVAIGEYAPGERFPSERELAATLGVGRVTVRAAIARLVERGLLRSQRGRGGGTFVVEPQSPNARGLVDQALTQAWERLLDQHEAECWLHGAIAAAAAERHTVADARFLSEQLEAYRTAASGAPAREADGALHLAIAAAAHTPTLSEVLLSLERRMHITAPVHPWGQSSGWRELESRSLQDHERLIAAILARDVVEAHEIGRRHARINMELLENARRRARGESPAGAAEGDRLASRQRLS
ncbi:FadR family transcriptional regulator [Actinomycetales bacterium SN12]|nr:FadR family transcriptional regulator [Actinomycetales bacterium SN12]